jgi:D-alanyl-D-alanine carboxypeptidase
MPTQTYESSMQSCLDQAFESGETHGIQVHIDSPKLALNWQGAAGFTDRSHNSERQTLTPHHPMRIASNTKPFVAGAILRLWEQQKLSLDNSIEEYISAEHSELIKSNGYALSSITIRHLLSHTSGFYDYVDEVFVKCFTEDSQRLWTRTEQLQWAMEKGEPFGQPGEVYRYSDTGYILLGEIIERVVDKNLGLALRQLLDYERLGLNETWLEKMEPTPINLLDRVHQYDGDVDHYPLDATWDLFGGGGLVSTVHDMARFMRGLFIGEVYQSPHTLKEMLTSVAAHQGGPEAHGRVQIPGQYRLGINTEGYDAVFFHRGYLGTYAAYVPSQDLAMSLSVSQHGGDIRDSLVKNILAVFSVSV